MNEQEKEEANAVARQAERSFLEQWVGIEGYPMYEVSNYGVVRNITSGRDIVGAINHRGKKHCSLMDNHGKKHSHFIHRLVAKHFLVDYDEKLCVAFKSSDQTDCSVWNLEMSEKAKADKWNG